MYKVLAGIETWESTSPIYCMFQEPPPPLPSQTEQSLWEDLYALELKIDASINDAQVAETVWEEVLLQDQRGFLNSAPPLPPLHPPTPPTDEKKPPKARVATRAQRSIKAGKKTKPSLKPPRKSTPKKSPLRQCMSAKNPRAKKTVSNKTKIANLEAQVKFLTEKNAKTQAAIEKHKKEMLEIKFLTGKMKK